MENYFGLLRYAFLILLSIFLFEVIRTLTRNMEEDPKPTSSEKTVQLIVIEGEKFLGVEKGYSYKFTKQCSIGRNRNNCVVIEDPFSSNFHSMIMKKRGKFYLSDMESKNGTFLNDEKVEKDICLNKDDTVRIGNVVLRFEP